MAMNVNAWLLLDRRGKPFLSILQLTGLGERMRTGATQTSSDENTMPTEARNWSTTSLYSDN